MDAHKIEAGLLAFGAITGIRRASPETARFMDGLGVRLRILRESTPDARLYTTSRLVYRNGYVLPELELESGVRHVAGPTTIRVTGAGTLGAEASHHTRGRVGLGARWERGRLFADSSATVCVSRASGADRVARRLPGGDRIRDLGRRRRDVRPRCWRVSDARRAGSASSSI